MHIHFQVLEGTCTVLNNQIKKIDQNKAQEEIPAVLLRCVKYSLLTKQLFTCILFYLVFIIVVNH